MLAYLHFNALNFFQNSMTNFFQNSMVIFIKNGYDQKTNEERWTFPAALMFTLRLALFSKKNFCLNIFRDFNLV